MHSEIEKKIVENVLDRSAVLIVHFIIIAQKDLHSRGHQLWGCRKFSDSIDSLDDLLEILVLIFFLFDCLSLKIAFFDPAVSSVARGGGL